MHLTQFLLATAFIAQLPSLFALPVHPVANAVGQTFANAASTYHHQHSHDSPVVDRRAYSDEVLALERRGPPKKGGGSGHCHHRRDLWARDETACEDIHLKLHDNAGTEHTHVIPKGTKNLGHSAAAQNNAGVYKIDKFGTHPGPHIAKSYKSKAEMDYEAARLKRLPGHHVASGSVTHADGKTTHWTIQKLQPGAHLHGSPELKAVRKAKDPAKCKAWLAEKHHQVGLAVQQAHAHIGETHGDVKNNNINFVHHAGGTSSAHLMDYGQMLSDNQVKGYLKANHITEGANANHNAYLYGQHRAKQSFHPSMCDYDSDSE